MPVSNMLVTAAGGEVLVVEYTGGLYRISSAVLQAGSLLADTSAEQQEDR